MISPPEKTLPLPLSTVQLEVWFDQTLHPHSPRYNIGGYIHLRGGLRLDVYTQALAALVTRHPMLVTGFAVHQDIPEMIPAQYAGAAHTVVDLRGEPDPEGAALAGMQTLMQTPLLQSAQPEWALFYTYQLSASEWICFIRLHHLLGDGYALSLLFRDTAALYNALLEQAEPKLKPPGSYARFLEKDHQYRDSARYREDVRFWQQDLAQCPEPLLDVRQSGLQGSVRQRQVLPAASYQRVQALALRENLSVFHLYAFSLFLSLGHPAGKYEFVLGLPVQNRTGSDEKNCVGLYAGFVPAVFQFQPEMTVREALAHIRGRMRRLLRHQRIPVSEINRIARLDTRERPQVFDIMLSWERMDYNARMGNNPVTVHSVGNGDEALPLSIHIQEYQEGADVQAELEFRQDYFPQAGLQQQVTDRIAAWLFELEHLLERPLSSLPACTAPEQAWTLTHAQGAPAQYEVKPLGQILHEKAQLYASRTALEWEGGSYSYAAYEAESNALAHYLRSLGAGPGQVIALRLEHHPRIAIAIAAVWKAGAAYVPIAPDFPEDRQAYLLEDTRTSMLITDSQAGTGLTQAHPGLRVVYLPETDLSGQPLHFPENQNTPEDLAYILYTSGSTGRPKGVCIRHRNLSFACGIMPQAYRRADAARMLAFTTYTFDPSLYELAGVFFHGWTLVFPPADALKDAWATLPVLHTLRPDTLYATPTRIRLLAEAGGAEAFSHLRTLLVGGEAFPQDLLTWLQAHAPPGMDIWNVYGPTEATVWCTCAHLNQGPVRLGASLPGNEVLLVNAAGKVVPAGIPAEIWAAGPGVGLGYQNLPEHTLNVFVPHPVRSGETVYRTGDLAWRDAEGVLHFLGRNDDQVKVRGQRIEPGEIRMRMLELATVTEALVMARPDSRGDLRLIAWWTGTCTADDLRAHLTQVLPAWMVPDYFVPLSAFPLLVNGKIDRKSLPEPEAEYLPPGEVITPRNGAEERIAAVWREMLGHAGWGVTDNFFQLGGNSLLAVRAAARLKPLLGETFGLKDFFNHPTIEAQARLVKAGAASPGLSFTESSQYPLSPGQLELWTHQQIHPHAVAYHMPFLWSWTGVADAAAFRQVLDRLSMRHPILRTVYAMQGTGPVQVVRPVPHYEFQEITAADAATAAEAVAGMLFAPFDLEQGPVLRVVLAHTAPAQGYLGICLHHIAGDAATVEILLEEAAQYFRGAEPRAAALPYGAFAQQEQARSGNAADAAYWTAVFQEGVPELPWSALADPDTTADIRVMNLEIAAAHVDMLEQAARQAGCSLFSYLQGITATWVLRQMGGTRLLYGVPVSGRDRVEWEHTAGYFVRTLPVLLDIQPGMTFDTIAQQVQQNFRGSLTHAAMPLREIAHLAGTDIQSEHWLPVAMNYRRSTPEWQAPGMDMQAVDLPPRHPQFTFSFDFHHHAQGIQVRIETDPRVCGRLAGMPLVSRYLCFLSDVLTGGHTAGTARIMEDTEAELLRYREPGPQVERSTEIPNPGWHGKAFPTVDAFLYAAAQQYADHPYLVWESQAYSYREVRAQVETLAARLQSLGAAPGRIIGICLPRGPEAIVAIQAVHATGAAFLYLDPNSPPERLAHYLRDAAPLHVISAPDLADRFPEQYLAFESPAGTPLPLQPVVSRPDDLAYVIYTSGTTGLPKGVMISQAAFMDYIHIYREYFLHGGTDEAMIQAMGLTFDASLEEYFSTGISGAQVILIRDHQNLEALFSLIPKYGITVLTTTPLSVQYLNTRPELWGRLRHVISGGDVLPPHFFDKIGRHTQVWNSYGPTETTICTTWGPQHVGAVVTLGRPHTSRMVRIADRIWGTLPPGMPGEIIIGGKGAALGYLNQPELTRQKFVPDSSGHIWYLTGDRGYWGDTGELMFLGRIDRQMKLRGYRLELTEVEAQFMSIPGVEAAYAEGRMIGANKELCVWISGHDLPEIQDMRAYLEPWLPAYMIPACCTRVDSLPMTPNGKVDAKSLPPPVPLAGQRADGPEIAWEGREAVLAQAWKQVLQVNSLMPDDSFFALGGDSIKALQVAAQVQQAGFTLEIRSIFEHPNFRAQAAHIQAGAAAEAGPAFYAEPLPLTPIQAWLFTQPAFSWKSWSQPVILQVPAETDPSLLESQLNALVHRHDALRMQYLHTQAGWQQQRMEHPPAVHLEQILTDTLAQETVDAVSAKLHACLDPEAGMLMAAALLRTAGEAHLLWIIHHLAVDAVSWRVLLGEMQSGVPAGQAASWTRWAKAWESPPPAVPAPYWQRLRAAWPPQPPALELTAPVPAGSFRQFQHIWDGDPDALVQDLEQKLGMRLEEALLAALADALGQYCGQASAYPVMLEGHGRNHPRTFAACQDMTGWFTLQYPAALPGTTGDSIGDLIRVKEWRREAGTMGLDWLETELHAGPEWNALRRAPISFNWFGTFQEGEGAWRLSRFQAGTGIPADMPVWSLLDFSGMQTSAGLRMDLSASGSSASTAQEILAAWGAALSRLAAGVAAAMPRQYTPSDFPHVSLLPAGLQAVQNWLNGQEIQQILPLSPLQAGMYYESRLSGQASLYLEQTGFVLRGMLDPARFEQAWAELTTRYPALRTLFWQEGLETPVQVVLKSHRIPVTYADDGTEGGWERALAADRENAFDLDAGVPARLQVIQLSGGQTGIIWTHHHLILDGWSTAVLSQAFFEAYAQPATVPVQPGTLPYTPPQPAGVAADTAFWEAVVGDYEPIISWLPAGQPGAPVQIQRLERTVPAAVLAELKQALQPQGLTLNHAMTAAWGLVLMGLQMSDDLMTGYVISGREAGDPALETQVGLLINTLPLRLKPHPGHTLADFMKSLRDAQLAAQAHSRASLAEIQRLSPAGNALLDHVLVFENYPVSGLITEAVKAAGWELERTDTFEQTNYPFLLAFYPGAEFRAEVSWDPARLSQARVTRILDRLLYFIGQIREYMHLPLAAFPVEAEGVPLTPALADIWGRPAASGNRGLNPAGQLCAPLENGDVQVLGNGPERAAFPHETAVLLKWASVPAQPPALKTLPDWLRAGLARAGNRPALITETDTVTYPEMCAQIAAITQALQNRGIGRGDVVAVLADKAEAIPALWAVSFAGGCWLPIDPAYPAARIQYLLEDSGARMLLLGKGISADTPACPVMEIPRQVPAQAAALPEHHPALPDDPAWLIYTSGSTGVPKGVSVPHSAAAAMADAWGDVYALRNAPPVMLQLASLSFDMFAGDWVSAYAWGGTLVLPDADRRYDPLYLAALMEKYQVSLTVLPPALALPILETAAAEGIALTSLKQVVMGGDIVPVDAFNRVVAHYGHRVQIVNGYGVTEATVESCTYTGDPAQPVTGTVVPVGRPVPHARLYVLRPDGRMAAPGMRGELCIGGEVVARGYHGRSELTAAHFVDDPWVEGGRMYRTGDMARWLPDGNLEFLGRDDSQVKVRGYRIELGEVEAAVTGIPGVREAVAQAREDASGSKVLAVWFTANAETSPEAVRSALQASLPAHLIPDYCIPVAAFPLTPNGKVNRKALELLQNQELSGTMPQTRMEQWLAAAWETVLDAQGVKQESQFYALGGNSIRLMRLAGILKTRHNLRADLRILLEHPILADQARALETAAGAAWEEIPVAEPRSRWPLSPAQKRLFFLHALEPESTAYHVSIHLEWDAVPDGMRFRQAWNTVIRQNDNLRARFFVEGEDLWQEFPEYSDAALNAHWRQNDAGTVLAFGLEPDTWNPAEPARITQAFTAADPIWLRIVLSRTASGHSLISIDFHHILDDALGQQEVLRQWAAAYLGIPYSPPGIRFRDYLAWQSHALAEARLQEQGRWWRAQYETPPPVLNLPTHSGRPAIQAYTGAMYTRQIPAEVWQPLQVWIHRQGHTPNEVLTAMAALHFAHWAAAQELVIGMVVSGRTHPQLLQVPGLMHNTIPLRISVPGRASLAVLQADTAAYFREALARQDYPLDLLLEQIQLPRDLSRNPLFDVMFTWLEAETGTQALPGNIRPVEMPHTQSQVDVSLFAQPAAGGLQLSWEYATHLFTADMIVQAADHVQNLLTHWVEWQSLRVDEMPRPASFAPWPAAEEAPRSATATETEWLLQRCLPAWQPSGTGTLAHAFRDAASQHAGTRALAWQGGNHTYAELAAITGGMVRHLQAHGVRPGDIVAVMATREIAVPACLAVNFAGACWLPVDPAYPQERIQYLLQDSGAVLLLTDQPADGSTLPVLAMDAAHLPQAPLPEPLCTPGDPAYLIYTSGSTGQPKGVTVPHRAAWAMLLAWGQDYGLAQVPPVILQMASISFDVFAGDLMRSLCFGGTMILPDPQRRMDPAYLLELVEREGITLFEGTPALVIPMMDEAWAEHRALSSLHTLILGGDVVPVPAWNRLVQQFGERMRILNSYGVTEATVDSCFYTGDPKQPVTGMQVPVGKPMRNVRLYVVLPDGSLAAPGARGELWIGGDAVALAYHNRPELSAEKFIPDPWWPGGRVYRTGDMARWLPDGNLEFLGRDDGQVKVRGFRIEIGEVEAAMHAVAGVGDVVVMTPQDAQGAPVLAAWFTAAESLSAEDLRAALQAAVPRHLIPEYLIRLDHFPLTPNGKVDRKALHLPRKEASPDAAPQTGMEQEVAAAWARVLPGIQPGRYDQFFEIGGQSIRAIQVVSLLRKALSREIPLMLLFEQPRLCDFAMALERMQRQNLPELGPVPAAPDYPLSPGQYRLWLLDELEGGSLGYHICGRIPLPREVQPGLLQSAVKYLLQRHEILRTELIRVQGEPRQRILPDVDLIIPQWYFETEAQATAAYAAFTAQPFHLDTPPLFRLAQARVAGKPEIWSAFHHIIFDGWSQDIFAAELEAVCTALAQGSKPELPALRVQYKEFAVWQQTLLAAGQEEARSFWHTLLAAPLPDMNLPLRQVQRPGADSPGMELVFRWDTATLQSLRRYAQQESVTLFHVLMAGFMYCIARQTGDADVVIGTPSAGRNHPDLQPQIGFYLNTLMVRAQAAPEKSFRGFVQEVRSTALQGLEHEQYPFESLVTELRVPREPGKFPVSPIFLNLLNYGDSPEDPHFPAETTLLPSAEPLKFDLSLYLTEAPDGLRGIAAFRKDVFTDSADFFAEMEQVLLRGVIAPDTPLAHLIPDQPVQVEEQAHTSQTLAGEIRRRALTLPHAAAVEDAQGVLTCADLHSLAQALAVKLTAAGATGKRVGILVGHNRNLPVSVLGIWLAGGSFVPLDAHYPAARLKFMLEDAAAGYLVVDAETAALLPEYSGMRIEVPESGSAGAGLPLPDSGTEAYLMYTSGSTGQPKGVRQTHAGLLFNMQSYVQAMHLGPHSRCTGFSSAGYDSFLNDCLGALLAGGTWLPYSLAGEWTPASLADWLDAKKVNVWHSVPAVWRVFAGALAGRHFPHLKTVKMTGEASLRSDWEALRTLAPAADFVVSYGATEATLMAIRHYTTAEYPEMHRLNPGTPVEGVRFRIQTAWNQSAGPWQPGLIWVHSPGMTPGFHHRPALETQAFEDYDGHRWYCTGDTGFMTASGEIHVLGRRDSQVKLRGIRLDLAELESAVMQTGAVQGVAAVVTGDGDHARLIAFTQGDMPAVQIQELKNRLPAFLMPAQWVNLPQIPVNAHGKTDRRQLQAMAAALPAEPGRHVAPQTETERMVLRHWIEVLGQPQAGMEDDFFAAGGHSLKAVQLLVRLARDTGREVRLVDFFAEPTPAALVRLLATAGASRLPAPQRVPDAAYYPVSAGQRRLMLLHALDPASAAAYNISLLVRLPQMPDPGQLNAALALLGRRHETLRTRFRWEGETPVQEILPQVELRVEPVADIQDYLNQPFALDRAPLFRMGLGTDAEGQPLLGLVQHHIVTDGTSLQRLLEEILAAYAGEKDYDAEERAWQYRDYAAWQHALLESGALQAQRDWWRSELEGVPLLDLPTEFRRPGNRTFRGGALRLPLSRTLSQHLNALAQELHTTSFVVMTGLVQAFLYRYSGQADFALGTGVSGRNRPEWERMQGFFVNTLALRSRMEPRPFRAHVQGLHVQVMTALEHADYPFDLLVEDLVQQRQPDRNPLFDVMVIHQNFEAAQAIVPAGVEAVSEPHRFSKFDLSFYFSGEQAYDLMLEYNADLWSEAGVRTLMQRFMLLAETLLAAPGTPLDTAPLLLAGEREALLRTGTGLRVPAPEAGIAGYFAEVVRRCAHHPALDWGGQLITYAELDEWSSQIAGTLGESSGEKIGLLCVRAPEMIAAIFGILKSGAAYVPLAPDTPPARLEMLLQDAGINRVLYFLPGMQALAANLPPHVRTAAIAPRDPATTVAAQSGGQADAPAYIAYTSGTTGQPKGVTIRQQSVISFALHSMDAWVRPGDRILQVSNYIFDGSVFDIFATLLRGGCLVLLSQPESGNPAAILDKLNHSQIDGAFIPSGLFLALAGLDADAFRAQRFVMFGGEKPNIPVVQRLLERLGPGKLVHAYGPTETTVYASLQTLHSLPAEAAYIPVGPPLPGYFICILDAHGALLPPEVPGEICIGGTGVGMGYVNQPEQTAARFIPNPYGTGMLYRTGDLGFWDQAGSLVIAGRRDAQVKHRGYRIEPDEIRSLAMEQPGIRQAFAGLRDLPGLGTELVLWYEAAEEPAPDRVLEALKQMLPAWMMPAFAVRVDSFPLTATGKLAVKDLPDPELPEAATVFTPETATEVVLSRIWRELLGKPVQHPAQTFFELGGHSLKVMRLVHRIRQELETDLPVPEVFAWPGFREMASRIAQLEKRSVLHISPAPVQDSYPLSPAQMRIWFSQKSQQAETLYNIRYGIRITGRIDAQQMAAAWEALQLRHEALRTRFPLIQGEPVQVIAPAPLSALQVRTAAGDPETALAQVLQTEDGQGFDLENGPPARLGLLHLSGTEHVLLLVMHHIVSDGWSMNLLFRDLIELYQAALQGRAPELPELQVQYKDYAWHLAQHPDLHAASASFWRHRLRAPYPRLNMPLTGVRSPETGREAGEVKGVISGEMYAQLQEFSVQERVPLSQVMLCCWLALLYRYTGQEGIVTGLTTAGREHAQMDEVCGMFVNVLPVRAEINREMTLPELLKWVQAETPQVIQHAAFPAETLMEEMGIERDPLRGALFDSGYSWLGMDSEDTEQMAHHQAEMRIEPLPEPDSLAKHELWLFCTPLAGELHYTVVYNKSLWENTFMLEFSRRLLIFAAELSLRTNARIISVSLDDKPAEPSAQNTDFDFDF